MGSSPISTPGAGGFYINHPANDPVSLKPVDRPENGIIDAVQPILWPSTGTIATVATGAGGLTGKVLTNLGPKIMYELGSRAGGFGAIAMMAGFGIPTLPSMAIAAGSALGYQLTTWVGNAVHSAYNHIKGNSAESSINKAEEELSQIDLIDALSKCESAKAQTQQEVRQLQREISEKHKELRFAGNDIDSVRNINAEIELLGNRLRSKEDQLPELIRDFDKLHAKRDALEKSIINDLDKLYDSKKELNVKSGTAVKDILQEAGIASMEELRSPIELKEAIRIHHRNAASATDETTKAQELQAAQKCSEQLKTHWKYQAALRKIKD